MEYINRVEIQGEVGAIRLRVCMDKIIAVMSVETAIIVTDYSMPLVERTWHQVVAEESEKIRCLENVFKGSKVHVVGRIRQTRYTSNSGEEKVLNEILASELSIIEE